MISGGAQHQKSARTIAREAFFLEFASAVRSRYPSVVLMLTGGFRTRAGAEYALSQGACDLVGIGRPAAVDPAFPRLFLDEGLSEDEAQLKLNKVTLPFWAKWIPIVAISAGAESVCLLLSFIFFIFFFLSKNLANALGADVLCRPDPSFGKGAADCSSVVREIMGVMQGCRVVVDTPIEF